VTHLERALDLVRINSVSRHETELADLIERRLRRASHLQITRIGDNIVARTSGSARTRVIVAGHIDTVPGDPSLARIEGDRLVGLGACDMKGSASVMLHEALVCTARSVEVTWIFYAREEITRTESGLLEIAAAHPDLLDADAALLAEPTGGAVEAGCQGTLRIEVTTRGVRAHSARPYAGRNAIHRMGRVIERVASYVPRVATIDDIAFTEQLQVVAVSGGVATNVVPDESRCTLNHRFAPDRNWERAAQSVRDLLSETVEDGDEFEVADWAPAALPSLGHDVIARLVAATGVPARAKMGWTDVATFAERGVPAANFGAGDPLLAHRSDEFVTAAQLTEFDDALARFLA
jgi:succinyl-diaminopimelate desuccinylase